MQPAPIPDDHPTWVALADGGPIERISLERSYHVATQDYDKDLIFKATVEFATRVAAQ